MAVVGQWTLHYDWGCSGSYSQIVITFNSDGTFKTSSTGKWVQIEGKILWQYDGLKTTYGGNVSGNAMTGVSSTFGGLNGCWYAIKAGSTAMLAEERKAEFDDSGNKVK
jgi:hypothetical protein